MKRSSLAVPDSPPLGLVTDATLDDLHLAREIDALHQLIYTRGGLNSTNAAIEEVEKLIFLRFSQIVEPEIYVQGGLEAGSVFSNTQNCAPIIPKLKDMFQVAQERSGLRLSLPDGSTESLWPKDEPFRLANESVAAEAVRLVDRILNSKEDLTDPLGTAFDAFLSGRYDHSGGLGTYLTPGSVARFMADIALALSDRDLLRESEYLLADPFCGTGRFLVAGYQALAAEPDLNSASRPLLTRILGADQSSSAISKSAINLILYGAKAPHTFKVEDSIGSDSLNAFKGMFPLVLTNPPFGGGKYDSPKGLELARKYFPTLSTSKIDPALGGIARGLELLSDNGILGIVLPDGIVNGRHFQSSMRDDRFQVVASVALPTSTFALSGTVVRTSAVFIKKKTEMPVAVLARAKHIGFIRKSGRAVLDPDGNDIPTLTALITHTIKAHEPTPSLQIHSKAPLVASVSRKALSTIDPNRFDAAALEARNEILDKGGVSLGDYGRSFPRENAGKQTGQHPFVSVLHIDAYGAVDWGKVESYRPVTPGQIAKSNDLIISLLNPAKLRAAVIPEEFPVVECSAEFGVFRGFEFPYAMLALLHDPFVAVQLRPLGVGTSSSRRRISSQDVLELAIPKLSFAEMQQLNEQVKKQIQRLERSRISLHELFQIS